MYVPTHSCVHKTIIMYTHVIASEIQIIYIRRTVQHYTHYYSYINCRTYTYTYIYMIIDYQAYILHTYIHT